MHLLQLAAAWRSQFAYPVVAITGSVGKTSTKEIIVQYSDLHGIAVMLLHHGNQNTIIGVALNILAYETLIMRWLFLKLVLISAVKWQSLLRIAKTNNCNYYQYWSYSYGRSWFTC